MARAPSTPPAAPDPADLPWWSRVRRFPRRLWTFSGELTGTFTDGFRRRPGKWTLRFVRAAVMLLLVLMSPWLIFQSRRPRGESASDVLYRHVSERWQTDPISATALVRETYETLVARGGYEVFKRIEVAPYGAFQVSDVMSVYRLLYDCAMKLGRYDEALAVARSLPGRVAFVVEMQVDCLLALGRHDEAISVLEQNLDLDGWRGELRERLDEVTRARGLRVV